MRRRFAKAIKTLAVGGAILSVSGTQGPAVAETSGGQTFTRVVAGTLGEDQPRTSRVIANGVVNAVGTERFDPDIEGDDSSYQTFVFPSGDISARATAEQLDLRIDPRSCLGILTENGREDIIGGTGAYLGAQGTGRLTAKGPVTAERNPDGSCDESRLRYVLVIRYTGTLRIP